MSCSCCIFQVLIELKLFSDTAAIKVPNNSISLTKLKHYHIFFNCTECTAWHVRIIFSLQTYFALFSFQLESHFLNSSNNIHAIHLIAQASTCLCTYKELWSIEWVSFSFYCLSGWKSPKLFQKDQNVN